MLRRPGANTFPRPIGARKNNGAWCQISVTGQQCASRSGMIASGGLDVGCFCQLGPFGGACSTPFFATLYDLVGNCTHQGN